MTRELIDSERLHRGVRYHYAAAATGETLVFTAGACPLDGDGRVVTPRDIPGQTRQALENLTIALREADCQPDDVVKTTVFVLSSSREDLLLAWSEYERVDAPMGHQAPCSESRCSVTPSSLSRSRRSRSAAMEPMSCRRQGATSGNEAPSRRSPAAR